MLLIAGQGKGFLMVSLQKMNFGETQRAMGALEFPSMDGLRGLHPERLVLSRHERPCPELCSLEEATRGCGAGFPRAPRVWGDSQPWEAFNQLEAEA